MKKNVVFYCAAAIVCLLVGCEKKVNCFTDDNILLIKEYESEKTVTGQQIETGELYDIGEVIYFKDYLLAETFNMDYLFHLITHDGQIIAKFGTQGRADNELLSSMCSGQKEVVGGHNCIWINDVNRSRMMLIDIDQSAKENRIVSLKTVDIPAMAPNCLYINDSLLLVEQMTNQNYQLNRVENHETTHENMYRTDVESPSFMYQSFWRYYAHKNMVVSAMMCINQLNFYDVATGARSSINIGPIVSAYNEVIDPETKMPRRLSFIDMEVVGSKIYALLVDQDYRAAYEEPQPRTLLVFDGPDRLSKVITLDGPVTNIAVSDDEQYIYAMVAYETLHRYRIAD